MLSAAVLLLAACGGATGKSSDANSDVTVSLINNSTTGAFVSGCAVCGSTSVGIHPGFTADFQETKPFIYKLVVGKVASTCPRADPIIVQGIFRINYEVTAEGKCIAASK
jgi:ethanolamine transporter EutH